jgi:AhpD family alkylhydroperoxidase
LIALSVAESNACDYCLSAHTYIGANLVKIDATAMTAARYGNSTDPKTDAILKFSKALVAKKA